MNKKTLEEVRLDLAMNLKEIRAEKGLAQERLALDAGVDRTVVSKIQRAKNDPGLDVLLKGACPHECFKRDINFLCNKRWSSSP